VCTSLPVLRVLPTHVCMTAQITDLMRMVCARTVSVLGRVQPRVVRMPLRHGLPREALPRRM